MSNIFHITARADWDAAQQAGEYVAPSLASEGFIHFSTAEQYLRVANMFYAGRRDLVLLEVVPGLLRSDLHWEPPVPNPTFSSELFPHLYGPLNLNAVAIVHDFLPGDDGVFRE